MSHQRRRARTEHKKRSKKPGWDDRFYVEPMPDYNAVEDENCPFTSSHKFVKHYANMKTNMELQRISPHHRRKKSNLARAGKSPYLSSSLGNKQRTRTRKNRSINSGNSKVLSSLFEKYKKRVLKLWDELNVPTNARDEFADQYFDHPSLEALEALADEIQILLEQRVLEADIQKAIATRETHLEKLEEMIADLSERGQDPETVVTKDRFMKAANELRASTLEVVEVIHEWKRFVRDGRAYLWRGNNYLAKIASDVSFINMQEHAPLFKLSKETPLNPFLVHFSSRSTSPDHGSRSSSSHYSAEENSVTTGSFMKRIKTAHRIIMQEALSDTSQDTSNHIDESTNETRELSDSQHGYSNNAELSPINHDAHSREYINEEEPDQWHQRPYSESDEEKEHQHEPSGDRYDQDSDQGTSEQEIREDNKFRENDVNEAQNADIESSPKARDSYGKEDGQSSAQDGESPQDFHDNDEYEDDFDNNMNEEPDQPKENTLQEDTNKDQEENSFENGEADHHPQNNDANHESEGEANEPEQYDEDFEDERQDLQEVPENEHFNETAETDNTKKYNTVHGNKHDVDNDYQENKYENDRHDTDTQDNTGHDINDQKNTKYDGDIDDNNKNDNDNHDHNIRDDNKYESNNNDDDNHDDNNNKDSDTHEEIQDYKHKNNYQDYQAPDYDYEDKSKHNEENNYEHQVINNRDDNNYDENDHNNDKHDDKNHDDSQDDNKNDNNDGKYAEEDENSIKRGDNEQEDKNPDDDYQYDFEDDQEPSNRDDTENDDSTQHTNHMQTTDRKEEDENNTQKEQESTNEIEENDNNEEDIVKNSNKEEHEQNANENQEQN
eukprot:gb/GECH01003432.1/.p1 GENE.gb/GECH01003432.1/~~gb/GECH01003432.1/.p1  ORF type:complete len:839 (+),score=232.85 gb/GECH01003432.1/:1-2517(+)